MSKTEESISFAMGILSGVVAGIIGGVLYAPKSGEETRAEIQEKTSQMLEKTPTIEEAKKASFEVMEKIKIAIETQINRINENIKAEKLAKAKEQELSSKNLIGE